MAGELSQGVSARGAAKRSLALDGGRVVAVLLVAYVHWGEQVFGYVHAGNPGPSWPDLDSRIEQWAARGRGIQGFLSTAVFRSSWVIEQAVGYFIMVTVVVLTVGAIARGTDFADRTVCIRWWYRRWLALWPTWALGHLILAVILVVTNGQLAILAPKWWASLAGVRFWPSMMYYLVPAWWYVGLLFQLYAILPVLITLARRVSARKLLVIGLPLALLVRAIGLALAPEAWLDLWARGGIVFSRLPDIIVGLAIAVHISKSGGDPDEWVRGVLRRPWVWIAGGLALLCGLLLSFFVLGNTLSPLLMGCAIGIPGTYLGMRIFGLLRWIAAHVFEFYVIHQVVLLMLVRESDLLTLEVVARALIAFGVALVATWFLAAAAAPLRGWLESITSPRGRER